MAEDLGDKTELPTTRRRNEARDRGTVARSQDLNSAIDLIGAVVLLVLLGSWLAGGLLSLLRRTLGDEQFAATISPDQLGGVLRWTGVRAGELIAPALVVMFVLVYVSRVAQIGWLITFQPVTPDINRLSPISGLKRLFSKRSLAKTGVNVVKLAAVGAIVVLLVCADFPKIAALAALQADQGWIMIGRMLLEMVAWILFVMLIIGLIDFIYQRWQHTQDLKMTKQEIKDERKMMEGDLEVKARRRRLARSMVLQQLHAAVPTADVVVTNPTHFSVAIRYDGSSMHAPKVVAKGADFLAFRIREIARAHNVTIVEKPPLARALYAGVEVGQPISPEYYEAVAEVLAYVYRLEGRAA
jgi:flagellar biosynthetic protein FlhB